MGTPTYTRAGIKRLSVWTPTLVEGVNDVIDLNLRTEGKLTIEDIGIDDVRGRQLPTYTKFKVEATSQNIGRPLYYYLLKNAESGMVNCEAVLTPSTSGVLQITGSNYLGIDFEYMFSGQERNAKVTLEGNFEKATATTLINNFATATPMSSASLGYANAYDFSVGQYFSPSFGLAQYQTTSGSSYTDLFEKEEIKERTFTAKTVSRKNVYEKSLVDYVEILAEYTIHNASATKVKALNDIVNTTFAPGVKIVENNTSGTETHIFQVGVLSLVNMTEVSESDRYIKLTFKGRVPLSQISYASEIGTYTYTL